jgi:NAD(P)-dependent dehydrogenase (short-subunit alcohol dehydrogenase family)
LSTGGTGGIGKATAAGLAALGARVGITARDQGRAAAAAADIRAATVTTPWTSLPPTCPPRRRCAVWPLRYFAFVLNHLAPFLLTRLLLDRVAATAPA